MKDNEKKKVFCRPKERVGRWRKRKKTKSRSNEVIKHECEQITEPAIEMTMRMGGGRFCLFLPLNITLLEIYDVPLFTYAWDGASALSSLIKRNAFLPFPRGSWFESYHYIDLRLFKAKHGEKKKDSVALPGGIIFFWTGIGVECM